jgi:hypothetical protein
MDNYLLHIVVEKNWHNCKLARESMCKKIVEVEEYLYRDIAVGELLYNS